MGCGGSRGAREEQPEIVQPTRASNALHTRKVVLVGDTAVGKSSVVLRYTKNQFHEAHQLTIGAAFVTKDLTVTNKKLGKQSGVRLHIWDTAGEEAYHSMTKFFYREAQIGIVVYDITQRDSFAHAESWIADFREQCPDASVVLVGNKCDIESHRMVPTDQGQMKAQDLGCSYFVEVSAKTNKNVQSVFQKIAEILYLRENSHESPEDVQAK